tara:strand:+ start:2218 stop:2655 length:438 start_codon:yes stop_codon:yes gene_type:complete
MATTTASLSLTSTDLFDDSLSISTSNTLNKAGLTVGLDQTTGVNKVYLTATTNVDLITVPGATKDGKQNYVYISNESTIHSEYIVVSIGDKVIGRLYAGDWMWMPWNQQAQHLSDIEIAPSVATGMWVEYMIIHEGIVLTSSADS